MERIFLSFGFRPEEESSVRPMVGQVEAILESHGIRPITGQYLGGEAVTEAIVARIQTCDGLIALYTPRKQKPNGRYRPPQFVVAELVIARTKELPAIALVHRSVDLEGAFHEHERIEYDPDALVPAIIKLSHTIGEWRRRAGRWVVVGLLPDELSQKAGRPNASCRYRLSRRQDAATGEWQQARIRPEPGGTFAYLSGIQDDSMIELQVNVGEETWSCHAHPQTLSIQLKKE